MQSHNSCLFTFVLALFCFGSCQVATEESATKLQFPETGFQHWSPETSIHTGWQSSKTVAGEPGKTELTPTGHGQIFYSSADLAEIKLPTQSQFDLQFEFQLGKNAGLSIDLPVLKENLEIKDNWNEPSNDFISFSSHRIPATQKLCLAPGLWQSLVLKVRADTIKTFAINGKTLVFADRDFQSTEDSVSIFKTTGHVAIRKLFSKDYDDTPELTLGSLSYKYYEGHFKGMPDFARMTPVDSGRTAYLNLDEVKKRNDHFAVQFSSQIEVEKPGIYKFKLQSDDGIEVRIDGTEIMENGGAKDFRSKEFEIQLEAGSHAFELDYYQQVWGAFIGLIYIGPNSDETYLGRAEASVPKNSEPPVLAISAESEIARMQRGFFNYQGKKLTEVIAVALPDQLNYAINLSNGALLGVWKGDFLDVGEMWVNRGEPQLMKPLGPCQDLENEPLIDGLEYQGYQLGKTGRPTFNFVTNGNEVSLTYWGDGKNLAGSLTLEGEVLTKPGTNELGESQYRTNEKQTVFYRDSNYSSAKEYNYEIIW